MKSRTGKSLCFAGVVVILFYLVGELRQRGGRETLVAPVLPHLPMIGGEGESDDLGEGAILEESRDFSPFRPVAPEPEEIRPLPRPSRREIAEAFEPMPSLVHSYQPGRKPPVERAVPRKVESLSIPPGTMIQCRLINTIESGALESPLIAKVLAPVRQNGRVLVPAGAELHGRVKKGKHRDRIETGSSWQLLLSSGKAIKVSGIGLNRDHDPSNDRYGISDGSIGLEGREIKPGRAADYKRFAATGLSAFSRFSQRRVRTVFGEQPLVTVRNGALEGGAAVVDRYADKIKDEAEAMQPYVRVPAGKEFYVYVTAQVTGVAEAVGEDDPTNLQQVLQQREDLMDKLRNQLSEGRR